LEFPVLVLEQIFTALADFSFQKSFIYFPKYVVDRKLFIKLHDFLSKLKHEFLSSLRIQVLIFRWYPNFISSLLFEAS